MKNVQFIAILWGVLRNLYPTIQEWVEAIDCAGFGDEKKKEIMEAVKATIQTTEILTGFELPWDTVIEPLASAFVEMAVRSVKRKLKNAA